MLKSTLADQVYDIIKNRIIKYEYRFGERIDIQKLEDEFGISQTPILFALNKLQKIGLVENRPRIGYFVLELTEKDLEEIYDLREMFEVYALKSAIKRQDADELEQLKEEIAQISKIKNEEKRRAKFQETDKRLHLSLINKSDNKRARTLFLQIYEIITISMFLGVEWEDLLEEHITLIDALMKQDLNEARRILKIHIKKAKKHAIMHLRTIKQQENVEIRISR